VSWKSARAFAEIVLAGALAAGCGRVVAPPKSRPAGALTSKRLEPAELFPSDLDLVLRIDVARMRAGLGPSAVEGLRGRAFGGRGEEALSKALACAEVVWIATRLADIDNGDRVVVVEGTDCAPAMGAPEWKEAASTNDQVAIFDRKTVAPRAGTARIITVGKRLAAFVSPVELDSVARVMHDGTDGRHGDPAAEGLVSVDLLARPLPPGLEKRFPSIGKILGGLDRVRGTAVLVDDGVRIDGEISSPTVGGADKARRFLEALRDGAVESKHADALRGLTLEAVEKTVRVRWVVPAKVVLGVLAPEGEPEKGGAGPKVSPAAR
jgi:hypothetical protein